MTDKERIGFQGEPGAYSELACRKAYPEMDPEPYPSFKDAIDAVRAGEVELAMLPIENTLGGPVADAHRELRDSGLHIIGEYFLRVRHHLLVVPGATLEGIERVESHPQALSQCRRFLRDRGMKPVNVEDTAGAARSVAERGDPAIAAVASERAGEIYGLELLCKDIADGSRNTTRFVVLSRDPTPDDSHRDPAESEDKDYITSILFQVRSVPAALHQALEGFAKNDINLTKLESHIVDPRFQIAQFHADVKGRPRLGEYYVDNGKRLDRERLSRAHVEKKYSRENGQKSIEGALAWLAHHTRELRIVGIYPAHEFRRRSRFEKVCIIGLGLIGGSLARDLRRLDAAAEIVGVDRCEEGLEQAEEAGVIDRKFVLGGSDTGSRAIAEEAVPDADVVVLAVPVEEMKPVLECIRDGLGENTIITDVGSVKGKVIDAVSTILGPDGKEQFVPAHPIAGAENSGFGASKEHLFEHKKVIVTPVNDIDPVKDEEEPDMNTYRGRVHRIKEMWELVGADVDVSSMDAARHDEVLAAASHLPQMLASTLLNTLGDMKGVSGEVFGIGTNSLRDLTRIASSDPAMWRDICLNNPDEIVNALRCFQTRLSDIETAIENREEGRIFSFFHDAKEIRDSNY